ncbi:MAG: hypothetical protein V7698_12415 [Paracoccaceae bacterium]
MIQGNKSLKDKWSLPGCRRIISVKVKERRDDSWTCGCNGRARFASVDQAWIGWQPSRGSWLPPKVKVKGFVWMDDGVAMPPNKKWGFSRLRLAKHHAQRVDAA